MGKKPKPNDLEQELITQIQTRGPITVAQFIRHVLTHPAYGYYMKRDVFGTRGDFTTSPEISQMFGELIGIWTITVWEQMGRPDKINIVEIGPGRGTLMMDLLRTARQFKAFHKAISVHLVEISPALREVQARTITGKQYSAESPMTMNDGLSTIQWHSSFQDVPKGPSIIVAQELFDCLPVHQFEYTNQGWRERLVDIDTSEGPHHFRFALTPGASVASTMLLKEIPSAHVGDTIEISPDAQLLAENIASFVGENGGGALLVDYGEERALSQSLKTIRGHSFKHIFESVGTSDISCSVDFAALKVAASKFKTAKTYGTVTQGAFLRQMGIDARYGALVAGANPTQAEELKSGYQRLIDPKEMGTTYKVMSIMNAKIGHPFGFAM